MEHTELQKALAEIESLKARVATLESIIKGCAPKQAGRHHKLSLEQRDEVVQKHTHGMSYSVLAKEYAVSKSTISNICRSRSRLHAPEGVFPVIHRRKHRKHNAEESSHCN